MRVLVTLLPIFSLGVASAANIDFTLKTSTAEVSFNGAPAAKVDLSVDLIANTANLVNGGGWFGSDRYLNLKAFVSSKTLGLSNVEAVTPLDVQIGGPAADAVFRNSTVLLVSEGVVSGIFNAQAVRTWNRVSSLGPVLGSATASGPLRLKLANGDTLSISTFESAKPWGNASFQAHLVPESTEVAQNACDGKAPASPVDGSLRKLGEKDLYLKTSSNGVQRFRLIAKTQFRDQKGVAIRDSLLHSGDQLSVVVSPDDPETALGVVLIHRRDHTGI